MARANRSIHTVYLQLSRTNEPRCCTGGRTGLGVGGGRVRGIEEGVVEANLLTLSAWCHARFTMRGYAPLAEYVHGRQEMEGGERR